jgi:hypothetical protein
MGFDYEIYILGEVYGEKGQIQTTKSFKSDIQAIKLKVYEKYFKTE